MKFACRLFWIKVNINFGCALFTEHINQFGFELDFACKAMS